MTRCADINHFGAISEYKVAWWTPTFHQICAHHLDDVTSPSDQCQTPSIGYINCMAFTVSIWAPGALIHVQRFATLFTQFHNVGPNNGNCPMTNTSDACQTGFVDNWKCVYTFFKCNTLTEYDCIGCG